MLYESKCFKIMKNLKLIILISLLISNVSAHPGGLLFPLDCELGKSCWISNLPRHHVQGKQVDFRCGPITYERNDGTDIALKDIKQMNEGVSVISPINGVVELKEEGMSDISAKTIGYKASEGRECGNKIVISNNEMQVKLCHLKNKSIRVSVGDEINAGDIIGEVGLSGLTDHPHLHISLLDKSDTVVREVDPFYGPQSDCGLEPKSLWLNHELMEKHAATGIVYNYGFAFENITAEHAMSGEYLHAQPEYTEEFIAFVDIFSVNRGDKLTVTILDSSNNVFAKREHEFGKYQARYFLFAGKNLRGEKLYGEYHLVIKYNHSNGKEDEFRSSIKL